MPNNAHSRSSMGKAKCQVVVIWIDWYAYHLARFEGLQAAFGRKGEVVGMELVGGAGVHAGMVFRQERPADLPIETLLPNEDWVSANKVKLSISLWKRLTKLNPATVLVPGYYTFPALAAAVWARTHGRTSVLMTESTAWDHERSGWRERAKSLLIRSLFNFAVCGGIPHRRYLQQLGFPEGRIFGSYDVVDNTRISEGTAAMRDRHSVVDYAMPENGFLYIGRLASEKGLRTLLNAWLMYREMGGAWPLTLVGNGPEMEDLSRMVQPSRFAREVYFAGHKGAKDLLPYLAFASCFVLPSLREPWGLVVNEAMAAGLPVLVSDRCGCASELVEDGANGFIFRAGDEAELARYLLIMESLPQAFRSEMGNTSRERIANFTPEHFGQQIAQISCHFGSRDCGSMASQLNEERQTQI